MEKTGFIYLWYDRRRKMYYLGCHLGTEDDGYICSSDRMREAHRRRPQDFKRRVIQKDIPRDRILEEEYKWLSFISDNELGKKYYNIQKHHFGHWSMTDNAKSTIEKRKETLKTSDAWQKFCESQKGKTVSEETREKLRKINLGKKYSEETKQKLSEMRKGHIVSEETRKKISATQKGRKQSPENVEKNRLSHIGIRHTEESKRKLSEAMKGKIIKCDHLHRKIVCNCCGKEYNVGNYSKHLKQKVSVY